ncbi:TetR/AcrR family transcriptional regulator [Streptomyces olivochromogenes]|uniref:TetR family transcriptional regulator n=1 Tax=Streptomyces olivochromogenes TaxID=1963 RepID=A0A286PGW8_STROL|nr:TetR/AcrR family transcriptional regulator [Streptomyces olivochromogenes]KUN33391.1 TetR family transcriptional regulator [Streptomyces olivochromogenes]GAX58797.1 TetR family transcriptional regulator [Streptomyces olivochromogenes]
MAAQAKTLRRDARDNMAKLRAAALEVFSAKGLGAPLEEIAKVAGVSVGTLYNRFGTREALIDSVIPEIAGSRLKELGEKVAAGATARERLETFVHGMIDLQHQDPALNDAIMRRFPEATALVDTCAASSSLGRDLVDQAHREGSLALDFTGEDLFCLLWMAGTANREEAAPLGWRRILTRALDSAWTDQAQTPAASDTP